MGELIDERAAALEPRAGEVTDVRLERVRKVWHSD
jgi:hypothetical protein